MIREAIPRGPRLQGFYRRLHALSLMGMNYGGIDKVGDDVAIKLTGPSPLVFDGGANVGDYTEYVLAARPSATIHAFEPMPDTFQTLQWRYPHGVMLHNYGLGDSEREATIYVDRPQSTEASILPQDRRQWEGHNEFHAAGTIQLRTIDQVCDEHGIERIDLLKLDLEGAEIPALQGATRMLAERRIGLIQFEYGIAGMSARVHLRDFFDLLDGWKIHRIVKGGIVPIRYHERFEILWTTNYLAIAPDGVH